MQLPALPYRPSQRAHPAPGIGIIAAGGIVHHAHLPAYRDAGVTVVAIADCCPQAVQDASARFGIPQRIEGYRRPLQNPAVQVVDIASWSGTPRSKGAGSPRPVPGPWATCWMPSPAGTGEQNLWTLALVEAAYRPAAAGRAVSPAEQMAAESPGAAPAGPSVSGSEASECAHAIRRTCPAGAGTPSKTPGTTSPVIV